MKATWSIGTTVQERDVASLQAVFELVTSIQAQVREPTVFELWDEETDAALSVVLGCALGTVLTFQAGSDPPYFVSQGTILAPGNVVPMRHNGILIEQMSEAFVPTAVVFPALAEFWDRRNRLPNLSWEQL